MSYHNRSRFVSSSTLSRNFSSLSASDDADDNEKQESDVSATDSMVLPKLNLLSTLESSPFQDSETTSEDISYTIIEKGEKEDEKLKED